MNEFYLTPKLKYLKTSVMSSLPILSSASWFGWCLWSPIRWWFTHALQHTFFPQELWEQGNFFSDADTSSRHRFFLLTSSLMQIHHHDIASSC